MKNQNDNTNPVQGEATPAPLPLAQSLPSFSTCVSESWNFVRARFDLFLFLLVTSVPSIFLTIALKRNEDFFFIYPWLGLSLVLVSLIIGPFVYLLALYVAVHHATRPSLLEAGRFVWEQFGSYLWLFTLASLVFIGSLALFIVPAIFMSGFMMFIGCVFIAEKERGFSTLLRSHALVRGRWWGIVWRIFGITFLWGFASGLVAVFGIPGLVASVILQTVSVMTLLFVVVLLYHARSTVVPAQVLADSARPLYYSFSILGLLIMLVVAGLALSFITVATASLGA